MKAPKVRDNLNQEERAYLIVLMSMEKKAEQFLSTTCLSNQNDTTCLSNQDRYNLEKVILWTKKFNEDLLNRAGSVIRRKIVNTLKINELRLESKYAPSKPLITEAATEDLEPAIEELRLFHCNGCTKCNYKDCAVYSISIACDIPEINNGEGCPFKAPSMDLDDDLEEWYE